MRVLKRTNELTYTSAEMLADFKLEKQDLMPSVYGNSVVVKFRNGKNVRESYLIRLFKNELELMLSEIEKNT